MPNRRAAWSSWNYLTNAATGPTQPSITYWMNRLQPLGNAPETFVTLNPCRAPREELVIRREIYEHPIFDMATDRAQKEIWSLQGGSAGHGFAARISAPAFMRTVFRPVSPWQKIWAVCAAHGWSSRKVGASFARV